MRPAAWWSLRTKPRIDCRQCIGPVHNMLTSEVPPTPLSQCFQRKAIGALVEETQGENSLKRSLGAGDLIMLAIGAVIGAGIFGAIGTAAAGQLGPNGEVIR